MKKRTLFAVIISLCIAVIIVSCAAPAPAPKPAPSPAPAPAPAPAPKPQLPAKVDWSTHATGTTHFAVSTGLGKVASEKGPILVAVAATAGPSAWVPSMNDTGSPNFGTAHPVDAWWAYTGKISPRPVPELGDKPFYAKAHTNLRVIAASGRMATGFLVRRDSPYKTISDLKGARIASGYLAQPSAFISMLTSVYNANLNLKDCTEVTVAGPAPGVAALAEGRVDATDASPGMGAIAEADSKVGVRFLTASLDPAAVKRAENIFPGGTYTVWKAGEAVGIREDTPLWTYPIMIVAPLSLSDAVVESVLGTWWDNYQLLWEIHPALKRITSPEMFLLKKSTVPYHPGAITFFKKKGIWDAAMDKYQDRLLKGEYPFLD